MNLRQTGEGRVPGVSRLSVWRMFTGDMIRSVYPPAFRLQNGLNWTCGSAFALPSDGLDR